MTKKNQILEILNEKFNEFKDWKEAHQYIEEEANIECNVVYFKNIWFSFTPSTQEINAPMQEIVHSVELTKIENIQFSDSILTPISSETILDDLISNNKGIMPATVTLVPGESGCGKTTILLHHFSQIRKHNPEKRLLYVSSEMNSIHIYKYSKRINMEGINLLLLSESKTPQKDLETILNEGWDLVLLDSLADTINKIRTEVNITEKAAETYVLELMDSCRRGNNKLKLYTAFQCTHHMTKGKEYTGSTNLKHMTDAMMEIKSEDGGYEDYFICFSKNRDGKKGQKLYFTITEEGVEFNEQRFIKDNLVRQKINEARQAIDKNEKDFESLFFKREEVIEVEEVIEEEVIE